MRKLCHGPVLSFDGVVKAPPHTAPKPLPKGYPRGPEPEISKKQYTLADVADALRDLGKKIERWGIPRGIADALPPALWQAGQVRAMREHRQRMNNFWRRR